ncbi:TonB-dependent receptor [Ferrimonas balearica]|uniref:TonB-dependent receptor n=1 Tax=Ferrimonas balearica TaxID=44012 RepID=UPI001F163413|nr:TonB-dependent receptor [Ferrimonas balearica]MBY6096659.1 TonB-dependent receptor [Ferrimonas balearica]
MTLQVSPSLVALCVAASLSAPVLAETERQGEALETMIISGSAIDGTVMDVSRSMTVISQDQVERYLDTSNDFGQLLAQVVPGMALSTDGVQSQKGQNNLRGRRIQLLIDGVPQNQSFIDFGQEFNGIDPHNIERIEVIRGGTALYGNGAGGGLINVITKKPQVGEAQHRTRVSASFNPDDIGDSISPMVSHEVTGGSAFVQGRFGASYEVKQASFDANGDRLPSDFRADDTDNLALNGAVNFNLDTDRSLNLSANYRKVEENDRWCPEGGNAAAGTPAHAVHCGVGLDYNAWKDQENGVEGIAANKEWNTYQNYTARYQDMGFALGMLDVSLYHMRQDGETDTMRMTSKASSGDVRYGYNETQFRNTGARAMVTSGLANTEISYGLDAQWQRFRQPNSVGFQPNTPDIDQTTLAAFAQFQTLLTDRLTLDYGVRYEHNTQSFDDFVVSELQSNAGNQVAGGDVKYDRWLPNAGLVYQLNADHQLFASYAQGFTTSEVLRGVRNTSASSVAEAVEIEPILSDNYEIGVRGFMGQATYSLAAFYSESDLGATLILGDDGVASVSERAPEEIWGVEATLRMPLTERLGFDGTVSWSEGERTCTEDTSKCTAGTVESLDATRISPWKMTATFDYAADHGDYALYLIYSGSRDEFEPINADGKYNTNQYPVDDLFLVNASASYPVWKGSLSVGVNNLLDELYVPQPLQGQGNNSRYIYASGRTVSLSYAINW